MQSIGNWKNLRTDAVSITLKFGFHQKRIEYSLNDACNSIIERLYRHAEDWIRGIANTCKSSQFVGRYMIYLFRISTTQFTMIPVVQSSDVEQNCLIEIVIVPIETDRNPHSLFLCQLNIPTNCSRCSSFIAGFYKQGIRCRNCRKTYHKHCAPFLLDDCTTEPKPRTANVSPLTFVNPYKNGTTFAPEKPPNRQTTIVQIYSMSKIFKNKDGQNIGSDTIIDKGIFPACIKGSPFYQRYLFRLTTSKLSLSTNLSPANFSQQQITQSNENELIFPLTYIDDVVLTHFDTSLDDIFEIYVRNEFILSVGKKYDPDELQMETAQFYSRIRDQRETLINATQVSNGSLVPDPTQSVSKENQNPKQETPRSLVRKESIYRQPPPGKDNENKDLHELYAFNGEQIGAGAFGRVMGAYRKSTHREVAIKIMEKQNCSEEDVKRINDEICHLYKFNHVNILKLEAYYERDDAVYVVTERMENDLCSYILNSKENFLDEDTSRMIMYQVIVALRYLHENQCGHLDIKCENILLSVLKRNSQQTTIMDEKENQDYPLVKLADFGYSRIIGEHSFRKTRVGTKVYNAPEIYSPMGYNRLADMWSVGIVLYATLSGTLPYDENDSQHAEKIISDKDKLFYGPRWSNVSKDAIDFLSNKLLITEPNQRITAASALFHNWFTDPILYRNLRVIEKGAKRLMTEKKEELPSSSNWLTSAREDPVWLQYKNYYAKVEKIFGNK